MAVSPIHSYPGVPSEGVVSPNVSRVSLNASTVGTTLNTDTAVYTSPAGIVSRISSLIVHNQTGAGITVTVHVVPQGSTAAIGNRIYTASVSANTTTPLIGSYTSPAIGSLLNLPAGSVLHILGSASGITVNGTVERDR